MSSAQGVRYVEEAVAETRVDYYAGRGEAPGVWLGPGAARLDLSGRVERDDLVRVFDGRHPATGEELGRHLALYLISVPAGNSSASLSIQGGRALCGSAM